MHVNEERVEPEVKHLLLGEGEIGEGEIGEGETRIVDGK